MFNKVFIKGSSFIKEIGYEEGFLTISMGNRKYTYEVTPQTFINFLFSDSKGKFYNTEIKKAKLNA